MARKVQYTLVSTLLVFMLTMWASLHPAWGQATAAPQQQTTSNPPQFKPVSLEHLYWHFLMLQNFLDTKAAQQESSGKDGSGLRNTLQKTLGWSDADYASIHSSSTRLTAEVKDLDGKATVIQKAGFSPAGRDQLKALTAQREAYINAEISYLKKSLPPGKIRKFEDFLPHFFSLAHASARPPSAAVPAPTAVQK